MNLRKENQSFLRFFFLRTYLFIQYFYFIFDYLFYFRASTFSFFFCLFVCLFLIVNNKQENFEE